MNKKLCLLFIALLFSLLVVSVFAQASIGIKTGDWVEYEGITTFEDQESFSELKAEIVEVKDDNVTISLTYFENGEITHNEIISGEVGKTDFQGFIIPANLGLGDTFEEGDYVSTISGYEERIIGEEVRGILSAKPNTQTTNITVYWDVETGFMVESLYQAWITINIKIVDTNLWQMKTQSPTTIIIVSIIILTGIGILTYFKKYRK